MSGAQIGLGFGITGAVVFIGVITYFWISLDRKHDPKKEPTYFSLLRKEIRVAMRLIPDLARLGVDLPEGVEYQEATISKKETISISLPPLMVRFAGGRKFVTRKGRTVAREGKDSIGGIMLFPAREIPDHYWMDDHARLVHLNQKLEAMMKEKVREIFDQ